LGECRTDWREGRGSKEGEYNIREKDPIPSIRPGPEGLTTGIKQRYEGQIGSGEKKGKNGKQILKKGKTTEFDKILTRHQTNLGKGGEGPHHRWEAHVFRARKGGKKKLENPNPRGKKTGQ